MDISAVCEDKKTEDLIKREFPQVHVYENVFPYVMRYESEERLKAMLDADEILVRTPDGLGFLLENGYRGRIVTDGEIYTFNRMSKKVLFDKGVFMDTIPPELNFHEIEERGTGSSELVVYGHVPMMISAQCLYKNTEDVCKKSEDGHRVILKDRMGKRHTALCICRDCINVIYNSVPLSLHTQAERIKKMGFRSLRLHFTIEEEKEALKITEYFLGLLGKEGKNTEPPFKEYTTGHFIKGVE